MPSTAKNRHRHYFAGLLVLLLFGSPLIALFDRAKTLSGIPVLWLYIYAAWFLAIILIWVQQKRPY